MPWISTTCVSSVHAAGKHRVWCPSPLPAPTGLTLLLPVCDNPGREVRRHPRCPPMPPRLLTHSDETAHCHRCVGSALSPGAGLAGRVAIVCPLVGVAPWAAAGGSGWMAVDVVRGQQGWRRDRGRHRWRCMVQRAARARHTSPHLLDGPSLVLDRPEVSGCHTAHFVCPTPGPHACCLNSARRPGTLVSPLSCFSAPGPRRHANTRQRSSSGCVAPTVP